MCKYCDIEEGEEPCDCVCIFEEGKEWVCVNGFDNVLIDVVHDCHDCEHEKRKR